MSNVIEFSIRAIDDFSTNMDKLKGNLTGLTGALASLGIAAAAYAAVNMGREALDNAESMGVAAEKANMLVEEYSALAWAAKQSNVEQGSLATGLKLLGRAMSEGDASQAGKSLSDLGVAAADANGRLRPTVDVLMDIADKFSNAAQDANKTKVAMDIFGRSGVDMVPMLNQGSGAIKDMMKEAQQLGFVISGDFAKSADQINDNFAALAQVMRGQVNVAMEQLAPTIELITGTFIEMAKEGDAVKTVGDGIAGVFKTLFTGGMAVVAGFEYMTAGVRLLVAGLVAAKEAATGNFAGAQAVLKDAAEEGAAANDKLLASLNRIKGMWDGSAESAAAAAAKDMRARMAKADALKVLSKEEEAAIAADIAHSDAMNKLVRELEVANSTFGMSAEQIKLYKLMVEGADDALIRIAADAVSAGMAQEEAAKRATVGTLEYKNAATDTMLTLNDLFTQQQEQAGSTAYQIAASMQQTFNNMAKGIGDAVANSVIDGKSLLDAMGDILKQVVKSIIATYVTLQVQRAIYAATGSALDAKMATGKISASSGELFVATWADVARNMPFGWAYGEAIAAGVSASAMATGLGFVAAGGVAHGGLDYVPAESTFLLDKGERVLSPRQNKDLTNFLDDASAAAAAGGAAVRGGLDYAPAQSAFLLDNSERAPAQQNSNLTNFLDDGNSNSSGGVTIQSLVIHVLENATNADAFARMDRVQLRNALGRPVVDALNEMFSIGVRPNFAMQNR